MVHRVLEIGPGDQPRHDVGGVELSDGDEYIALDPNPSEFDFPIWRTLKEKFGSKVRMILGSREAIPENLGVFDEVVMLGSHGYPDKDLVEIDRVLATDGVLKFGVMSFGKDSFLEEWSPELEKRGYVLVNEVESVYVGTSSIGLNWDLKPVEDPKPEPYTVLTFKKG